MCTAGVGRLTPNKVAAMSDPHHPKLTKLKNTVPEKPNGLGNHVLAKHRSGGYLWYWLSVFQFSSNHLYAKHFSGEFGFFSVVVI